MQYWGGYYPELGPVGQIMFRYIFVILITVNLLCCASIYIPFFAAAADLLLVLSCLQPMFVNLTTMRHVLRQPVTDANWNVTNRFFRVRADVYMRFRAQDARNIEAFQAFESEQRVINVLKRSTMQRMKFTVCCSTSLFIFGIVSFLFSSTIGFIFISAE